MGGGVSRMSRMSRVSTRVSSVHAEKNLKRGYNEFSKVARKSDKAQNAENQLKHFDCELTVMLMLHERGSPPGSFVRRLVHMSDNLKYAKFQQWALVTLYGKDCKHPKDYLAFEYVNDVGKVVGISNYDELRGWMNKMWFQHPLELHVIEKGAKKHSHMQSSFLEELFLRFDLNGDGIIDPHEQLMARGMSELYDADQDDVGQFLANAFKVADHSKDGRIDFNEFQALAGELSEAMKNGFVRSSGYKTKAVEAKILQDRSWRTALGDVASQPPRSMTDIMRRRGGALTMDANPLAECGISLRFPTACVTDSNRSMWVHCMTVCEALLGHYEDPEARLGVLVSTVVVVDFEAGLKLADGTHYELHVPHCLAETSASGEALSKADVIVVTAPHQVHSMWSYVDPADFDLVPPEKDTLPGVVVRSASPGIYAVYSRGDVPVQQRVLCLAFVPFKVNPLDTEVMRLRIVPDLPTAVQGAFHAERVARGLVVAAGCSPVFTVKHRHNRATTQLRVQVSDSRDGRLLMREDIWWDGEYDQIDCLFEPNEWFIDGITKATAKFDVQMTAAQLTEGVRLTQPNHLAVEPIKFDAKILVHLFPAPSPPKSVRVVHRTSTNLKVEYEPPEDWGGCALTEYQLELREKTHKGDWTEWNLVATANGWERAISVSKAIYACELRVRAKNCGAHCPSQWSDVVVLGTEAEVNKTKLPVANPHSRGLAQRADRRNQQRRRSVQQEGGVAVVLDETDPTAGAHADESKNWNQWKGSKNPEADMAGWSEPAKACGRFFAELGVQNGPMGTCFDLDVNQTLLLTSSEYVDQREPLIGLAMRAVWVMETLAHHSATPTSWITLINALNGMVSCAAFNALGLHKRRKGESDAPVTTLSVKQHAVNILHTLLSIYETLWQHCDNGFVTQQLEHRYAAPVRKAMKREFKEHLDRLVAKVAHEVTEIHEVVACLSLHDPTTEEKLSLGRLLETHAMSQDAVGAKVRDYMQREEAENPNTVSFTKMEATLPRSGGPSAAPTLKLAASTRSLVTTVNAGPSMSVAMSVAGSTPVRGHTFTATHMTKPKWTDEIVTLPAPPPASEGGAIALPISVKITVVRGAADAANSQEVGVATVELHEPLGRIDTALLDDQGAAVGRVSMLYQAARVG